jgi:hypothetical protein
MLTNQNFLDQFYLQYDKVATLQAPGYGPNEIQLMAQEAQELLILTSYNPLSNRLKEGFEETEKRIQDLGNLVRTRILTPQALSVDNMANGRFFQLPNVQYTTYPTTKNNFDVYWFTVYEQAITDQIDYCLPKINGAYQYKTLEIIEINHNEYVQLIEDPFNKPTQNKVWRMRSEGGLQELITDGTYNITGYKVRYIRKPRPIILDGTIALSAPCSELADHTHYELVRKTLEIATRNINDYTKLQVENNQIKE